MLNPNMNELSHAKQLISESKFKEAIDVINELENKNGLTLQNRLEIHHLKSSLLLELGYMNSAIKYIEIAYKESKKLKNKFQIIDVLLTKSHILKMNDKQNEALRAINEAEQILSTIKQISSKEFKEKKAHLALQKSGYYFNVGDFDQSLNYCTEGFTIAEEIKNKNLMMLANRTFAFNYYYKGDIDRAYEYNKYRLELAKEINDKQEIIGVFNSIGMYLTEKGDFNQALDHLEQGLSLCNEINSFKTIIILCSLFDLYFYRNSLEKAQECLNSMKQFMEHHPEYKASNIFYDLAKAMMLKKDTQKISHLKAKEILKKLIDKKSPFSGIYYPALIHLCDVYLTISCETNDLKILDEIDPYLNQLKNNAKTQQSFWLLIEAHLLQAKLKLITFEFREAKNLLSQALDVAEKYGQDRLIRRITDVQDELSKDFIKWEKLKASGATISARMNLAHIDEQIEILLQKRRYLKDINV
ncbi:MAG: hypothetical protein ACFE91_11705 [Promethearchaeota archaeon]